VSKGKLAGIVVACTAAIIAAIVIAICPPNPPNNDASQIPTPTEDLARVTRVIDGDTVEVDIDGSVCRVRYIGIDTPETVHPSESHECSGKEARAHIYYRAKCAAYVHEKCWRRHVE